MSKKKGKNVEQAKREPENSTPEEQATPADDAVVIPASADIDAAALQPGFVLTPEQAAAAQRENQTTDELLVQAVESLQKQVEQMSGAIGAISASAAAAAELNTQLAARVHHLERMLGVDASSAAEGAG